MLKGKIGIFDSGYGGLTILKEIIKHLPQYDYIYLGDNARTPYGTRSFETVYKYSAESVAWLFNEGCELIIFACNTASAKALRTIQMVDLLRDNNQDKRVLGVIRPTVEAISSYPTSGNIGVFATSGTVASLSYPIEIEKMYGSAYSVTQLACPMFVPLIENNEINNVATKYFVDKYLKELFLLNPKIDTLLLACTHYPILADMISAFVDRKINIISQGDIVAESLMDYLKRHSDIEQKLSKQGKRNYYTTDDAQTFKNMASFFMGHDVECDKVSLL